MNFKTLHCSWCRGKVAPCYESVVYEAVAAATSESTSVEPGKLDVGATEGHELQHIGNQKMPIGPPEDCLSLKSLPPSEEDNDDAHILPSPVLELFLGMEDRMKIQSGLSAKAPVSRGNGGRSTTLSTLSAFYFFI
nr:aspartate-rich protein 1-like isoform X2 [Macaca nemestrina]